MTGPPDAGERLQELQRQGNLRRARRAYAAHLTRCQVCRDHLRRQTGMCEAGRWALYALAAARDLADRTPA